MFRPYTPKDNVQKKSYYTDRFYVTPSIPKDPIEDSDTLAVLSDLISRVEVVESYSMRGMPVIVVEPKFIKQTMVLLISAGYEQLMEMSANDYLATDGEFELFYELLSISKNRRIRVKCRIKENEAVESVSDLWRSANWSEREAYDMFGIIFNNHPHLKRILMPDDWHGFPLRKTYPLHGDEFAQWYEVDKIYGKEFRDVIGSENRDPARIDRHDTIRFSRLGREVFAGVEPKDETTPIQYLEKRMPVLHSDFDPKKQKVLDKRK